MQQLAKVSFSLGKPRFSESQKASPVTQTVRGDAVSLTVSDSKAQALRATLLRESQHELPWQDLNPGVSGFEVCTFPWTVWCP